MSDAPECKPIVDAISLLQKQEQTKLNTIATLGGADKWNAMQALGDIRQQITQQKSLLDQCNQQHAADLTINIDVTDIPGDTGPNRIGRAWKLGQGQPTLYQTATVQSGSITFNGILGPSRQSFGVSIEGTDDPRINGPDFRSGPLPPASVPPIIDPVGQIEIVILSPFVITPEVLAQAVPPLPIQGLSSGVSFSVTMLQFTTDDDVLNLAASGSATGMAINSTFAFQCAIQVAPSYSMSPSRILEISPSASPKLSMPGLVASGLAGLTSFIANLVDTAALQPLGVILNNFVTKQIASSLGLSVLPSGSVLSVRQLKATAKGLSVTPVLGAFGTVLSDFQPASVPSAAKLIGVTVEPSSISTGDPTNMSAKGTVTFDRPAPADEPVQVSVDRPDLITINPIPVLIPAGKTSGTFVASAIPQLLASTAVVDATVTASLRDQSLTAPIAVRPEPAVTPPANTGTSMQPFRIPPPPQGDKLQGLSQFSNPKAPDAKWKAAPE